MKKEANILILLLAILSISTQSANGQETAINNEESSIVLSEATITSIAELLYQYKKDRAAITSTNSKVTTNPKIYSDNGSSLELSLLQQEITALKNKIAYNNTAQVNNDLDNAAYTNSLKRDLNNMEDEIWRLNNNVNTPKNPSIIVVNSDSRNTNPAYEYGTLEKQLDSLLAIQANKPKTIENDKDYSNEFAALQLKLNALQNNAASNVDKPTNYEALKLKYKGFNEQILFANNSTILDTIASKVVNNMFSILETNDNVDILLKGFASNKGLPYKNEQLSMLRTEAVKKALVAKGIHPSRILTQYHGIDYETKSDVDARRVAITLVVRK